MKKEKPEKKEERYIKFKIVFTDDKYNVNIELHNVNKIETLASIVQYEQTIKERIRALDGKDNPLDVLNHLLKL